MLRPVFMTSCFVISNTICSAAWSEPPSVAVPSASTTRDSFGVREVDGAFVGGGRAYRTEITADGLSFTPAFGKAADRTYPWTFTLDWIGREDGTTVWSDGARRAAPQLDGTTAIVERAHGIAERYEHRADGVEQSFAFAHAFAGSGDLIVRGHVTTDLLLPPSGPCDDGAEFNAPALGAVTLSSVIGIDASGAMSRGSMRIDGTTLEYRLDAAYVDHAAYPLVLDPMIGTATTVASGYDEEDPDSTFDASLGKWCVVWRRVFASNDGDVRAQFVDNNGSLVGGLIFVESNTGVNALTPRVADMNHTNDFTVVWQDSTGFLNGTIKARVIDGASGTVSPKLDVGATTGLNIEPDVGGEFSEAYDFATVAWRQFDIAASQWRIMGARIGVPDAAPALAFPEFVIASGFEDSQPAISNNGGAFGYLMVVWKRTFSATSVDIRGAVLDRFGAIHDSLIAVTSGAGIENAPTVDGDGFEFAVGYEDVPTAGAGSDFVIQRVGLRDSGQWNPVGPVFTLGLQSPGNFVQPQLAWLFGTVVGTWRGEVGTHDQARMFSFDPFALQTFETVALNPIDQAGVHDESVRLGTGIVDTAMATVERENVTGTGNLIAYRHLAIDGTHQDLGGGCGGRLYAMAAKVGNPNFRIQLAAAKPNAASYLIVSGGQIAVPCGSCVLVANPNLGLFLSVGSTNVDGDLALATGIPNVPAYVGLAFIAQWLTVDAATPGCPSLGVDFSNAVKVTLQ